MSHTLIELSEDEVRAMQAAARRAEEAAENGSDGLEVEALREFVELALEALGVDL